MGEPITLKQGKDTITVHGRYEAARQVGRGWQPLDKGLALPPTPIDATDAAREFAENHNIDLSTVKGTGQDGRIILSDVKALVE